MVHLKMWNVACAQSYWEVLVDLNGVIYFLDGSRNYGSVIALIWELDVENQRGKVHWAKG